MFRTVESRPAPPGVVTDGATEAATRIESARHPAIRRVADVLRASNGVQRTFLIDDEQNIDQAHRCGVRIDSIFATEGEHVAGDVASAARRGELPLYVMPRSVVHELFRQSRRSRVFALARRPAPPTLAQVARRDGDVVVLDGVRVPGNIGAITRSAAAFGAAGVVLVDSGLTSSVDRRLIRASRGLVFSIPVVLATREDVLAHLHELALPIAVLSAEGDFDVTTVAALPPRLALVLGSEVEGHSAAMSSARALHVRIPMHAQVESLNVSTAAAIVLHHRSKPPRAGQATTVSRAVRST